MTLGEQLYDILQESTDQYIRTNHIVYPGGRATPTVAPDWVTQKGVDVSMLYRYQVAHIVYHGKGEEYQHPSITPVKTTTLRVMRKRKMA